MFVFSLSDRNVLKMFPHTLTRLVYIIIPVECVAQRREVNQFVQSDILLSVFVLAPAIDQPSLYKCNEVKP